MNLKKVSEVKYIIEKEGKMRTDAVVFANENILPKIVEDKSLEQLKNVASLPGILGSAIGMPDIHWGYGMPVGGVAAFDAEDGIIGPGMIGFDINCGVRLHTLQLEIKDIKDKIEKIVDSLFEMIPAGVGLSGHVELGKKEMKRVCEEGVKFVIENLGYGSPDELENIESYGCIPGADFSCVSEKAYERGRDQLGTVGSGNHFVELGYVEKIFRKDIAEKWGIHEGQVTLLVHSGSRGFGHQICEDYLKVALRWCEKNKAPLPDRQLAYIGINSPEAKNYIGAMNSAINYAFSNRLIISHYAKKAITKALGTTEQNLGMKLLYDVAHNTAKFEIHKINGKERKVIVHRKGATRAFPKGHPELPGKHKEIGQPVIIPGDMGRYSYLLVGNEKSMDESFGSTCHGSGRMMSRKQAIKTARGRNIRKELLEKGIVVKAREVELLAEEMSEAYKDVSDVVEVCEKAGLSLIVAKLRPVGVIKG
jgi:tRNA-splicing ligase RtcB